MTSFFSPLYLANHVGTDFGLEKNKLIMYVPKSNLRTTSSLNLVKLSVTPATTVCTAFSLNNLMCSGELEQFIKQVKK